MLPVEKKADCRRKRKKREMRASDNVRLRYREGCDPEEAEKDVSVADWNCFDMSGSICEIGFGSRVGGGGAL